jgi:hypothetical protein
MLTAVGACAQPARLVFLQKPKDGQSISGVLHLRISADPFSRPSGVQYVVAANEEVIAVHKSVPAETQWDTTVLRDGEITIRLIVRNPRLQRDTVADEFTIRTANRFVPKPPAAPPSQPAAEAPSAPVPAASPGTPAARTAALRRSVRKPYTFPDPLKTSAAHLSVNAENLWIGRANGGLVWMNLIKRTAQAVDPDMASGAVRAVLPGKSSVWWLCDASPQQEQFRRVLQYRFSDNSLSAFDLPADLYDANRLLPWREKILLCGRRSAALLDPETGTLSDISEMGLNVPPDAGAVFVQDGDRASAVLLQPRTPNSETDAGGVAVTLLRETEGAWRPAASLLCAGISEFTDLIPVVKGDLLVVMGQGRIWSILMKQDASPREITLPKWRRGTDNAVFDPPRVWWNEAGNVLTASLETGRTDAFLGWHGPNLEVLCAAGTSGDCWVSTPSGIRRIVPDKPNPQDGYGGFIRVRLGADGPRTTADRKMAQLVEEWQGTPYLWGGAGRNGTDCSGFVMAMYQGVGIGLGHGSAWLRETTRGKRVFDELQYGDVLVIPGHAMLYIGDGNTAETVSGRGVSKSTIWGRGEVIVKRFMGVEGASARQLAARKSKPRNRKR